MLTESESEKTAEFKRRFKLTAYTEKWAVTMTKVRIRQAVTDAPFPRWHLLTFSGPVEGLECCAVLYRPIGGQKRKKNMAETNPEPSESQKVDAVVRKILSVSRKELQKRERAWQRKRARKKRAKI